ncbi:MAG: hypothetical protein IJ179_06180 [Oscillospiraceae bacterium]|nr:hypothetical protein [Oscillospiraceae bacterium]MBQ9249939.1 hypothetical protein [Oscillospiraceae bacterium]
MKITVTFDTLEEFQKHITGLPITAPAQKATEAPQSDEEPKPKKNPKKAEKPQEEEASQPDEAPAAEVSEDFRVEVRKTLAQLNKKVGKNLASELIKGFGVEKLTDVALSDLPALMDKAKEALNAE